MEITAAVAVHGMMAVEIITGAAVAINADVVAIAGIMTIGIIAAIEITAAVAIMTTTLFVKMFAKLFARLSEMLKTTEIIRIADVTNHFRLLPTRY